MRSHPALAVLFGILIATASAISQNGSKPLSETASANLAEAKRLAGEAMAQPSVKKRIALLEQAAEVFPDVDGPHFLLGVEYQLRLEHDKAMAKYAKCLDINPEHYLAHFNVGQLHMRKSAYRDALASYDKALELATEAKDARAAKLILEKKIAAEFVVQRDQADKDKLEAILEANKDKLKPSGTGNTGGSAGASPSGFMPTLVSELRAAAAAAANALPPGKQQERLALRAANSLLRMLSRGGTTAGDGAQQDTLLLTVDLLAYVHRDNPAAFTKLGWLFQAWGAGLDPQTAAQIAGTLEHANQRTLDHDGADKPKKGDWRVSANPSEGGFRVAGRYRLESTYRSTDGQVSRVERTTADVIITQSRGKVVVRQTNSVTNGEYRAPVGSHNRQFRTNDTTSSGTIRGRIVTLDQSHGVQTRLSFSEDGRTATFSGQWGTGTLTRK